MALIKCIECGKEFSDQASSCPNCACPVQKKIECSECGKRIDLGLKACPNCGNPIKKGINFKIDKKVIIGFCILVVLVVGWFIFNNNGKNKLVCTWKTTNEYADVDNSVTYIFSDDKIKSVSAVISTRPSDSDVAEYLWTITNKNQDQYNYYDGVSFKATYSENKEITIKYNIDVQKAPNMFKAMSTIDGVSGVTSNSTKSEIKTLYEQNSYKCK